MHKLKFLFMLNFSYMFVWKIDAYFSIQKKIMYIRYAWTISWKNIVRLRKWNAIARLDGFGPQWIYFERILSPFESLHVLTSSFGPYSPFKSFKFISKSNLKWHIIIQWCNVNSSMSLKVACYKTSGWVGQWPHGNWALFFGKTPVKRTTTTMDPSKFIMIK